MLISPYKSTFRRFVEAVQPYFLVLEGQRAPSAIQKGHFYDADNF